LELKINRELLKYYCKDCGTKIHWMTALYSIGKYLEYKFMTVGMKDLPRIPKMIRLREDK